MGSPAREDFVAAFRECRSTTLVGFAVTGGVFGEGIDLKGEHLIGVLVVGVGLPGLCTERDLISASFGEEDRETGFRFAYQYPGINRVLQTAGRVIRSVEDRGIVCLIDRRFTEAQYAKLLPGEWRVMETSTRHSLTSAVNTFWNDRGSAVHPCNPPDIPHDSRDGRDGRDRTVSIHGSHDGPARRDGDDATGRGPGR
ncbi:MAG: helicase C-terminal domain-containing protein [Gammaproteobacteria bacterium]|nr:helicase C-terminal domain-containing protein [Gammaproteobacteria bacterium]